ncbi:MAG: DUF502 domain-containing protein [Chitinivibrionales bacterium]|nr:DUF502 domain-containing protein [Chitinivibrionales bacterium]
MKILLKRFLKQIRRNVIAGVLLIIPSVTTLYVFIKLFGLVDSILPSIFHSILPFMPQKWTPGVGILVSLILAYFIGVAAKNYLGRKIIDTGNSIIARMPILNKIYSALQQVVDSLSLHKKNLFDRVVLVEFPLPESLALGFITSEKPTALSDNLPPESVAVFVPTTPNPTSGFLVYIQRSKIRETNITVENALKIIVSAGIISTDMAPKNSSQESVTPIMLKNWKWTSIFKKIDPEEKS